MAEDNTRPTEDTPNSMGEQGEQEDAGDTDAEVIDNSGEKTPINTNNVENAHVKVEKPAKAGCLLTRTQVVLLAVAILLLVIVVGLLAGVLSRRRCEDQGEDLDFWKNTPPKPTVNPSKPWSDIRLPRNIVPSHYNISLRVDLEKFVFSGSVDIDVECTRDTEYVIIHANSLDIKKSQVVVRELRKESNRRRKATDARSTPTGRKLDIKEHVSVPINQFWVLRMKDKLKKNRKYAIRFGHFEGKILDDLRGLYKSTYKGAGGQERSVTYHAFSRLS